MKMMNVLLTIFLISGFLMVPSAVFAMDEASPGSASLTSAAAFEDVLEPQVKGSSRSSSKIKISDGDDDVSGEVGGSWWIFLIIGLIIVIAIIAVWYFFLRK